MLLIHGGTNVCTHQIKFLFLIFYKTLPTTIYPLREVMSRNKDNKPLLLQVAYGMKTNDYLNQ